MPDVSIFLLEYVTKYTVRGCISSLRELSNNTDGADDNINSNRFRRLINAAVIQAF